MRRFLKLLRRTLLLVVALVAVLAAVLAFNVFSHPSKQLQVAAIAKLPPTKARRTEPPPSTTSTHPIRPWGVSK